MVGPGGARVKANLLGWLGAAGVGCGVGAMMYNGYIILGAIIFASFTLSVFTAAYSAHHAAMRHLS